jgi:hypothetical protein
MSIKNSVEKRSKPSMVLKKSLMKGSLFVTE